MQPLVAQFPENPVFHLMLGDLYAKLRRNEQAAASYRAAQKATGGGAKCRARVAQVAQQGLQLLSH